MSVDPEPWLADPAPDEARLQALFMDAIEAGGAEARERVLVRVPDGPLRERLRELLAAHDALPAERVRVAMAPLDPGRLIGLRFGDFTVESFLASGGTADVYIARQGSPVRSVVLKVRRARHGSDGQVRRFLAEAERLANFSHPGVAHIYGSGTDHGPDDAEGEAGLSGGVAWIAMERIDGLALADWRATPEATVAARVALVARVAGTVAAAHEHGIVHRDLAPANIRVDRSGAPRLIDFGISRTLHAFDEHPTIEGTPGFASPEQVRGEAADPRDDVFALGRLLAWLVPDASAEVAEVVADATGSAGRDRVSASELETRLRRLGEPPAPRGSSATRVLMALGALAVAMLVVAMFAVLPRGGSPTAATSPVSPERAVLSAEAVERVLSAVLENAGASGERASSAQLIDDTARAEAAILAEIDAPARVRWRALEKLALVWRDLGQNARAVETGRHAARIAESDSEAPALIAERLRAWVAVRLANGDDRDAALAATRASLAELAGTKVARDDGSVAPPEGDRRDAHQNYAQAHVYLALAAKLCGELELSRVATEIAGPFHRSGVFAGTRSQITYLINAARLSLSLGEIDRAQSLGEEAVRASATIEADNPTAQLSTLSLQAGILEQAGRLAESAAIYRRAIETWTAIAGPNDPKTITAINNLGLNLVRQGDAEGAVALLEDACARALRVHGERHQHTIDNHGNLVLALDAAGRTDAAVAILERMLSVVEEARGSPSVDLCDWLLALGQMRAKQGRTADARAALERVLAEGEGLAGAEANLRDARTALEALSADQGD